MRLTLGLTPILTIMKKGVAMTALGLNFLLHRTLILLAITSLAVTLAASPARADASDPPITTPPAAGATPPPAEAIVDTVDPVTPCTGWYLQSSYGGTWPTESTWWEYSCAGPVGAMEPSGTTWTDHYYWDSTQTKSSYYGQRSIWYNMMIYDGGCLSWWDQATNLWYGPYGCSPITPSTTAPTASFTVNCSELSCSFDASASTDSDGTIQYYSWDFGDGTGTSRYANTAEHTYGQAGTYTVQLTVTDDNGESGTDTQAVAVVVLSNAPPTARLTVICAGLNCSFDASASTDSDGTINTYGWSFGDGSSGSGVSAQHAYAQPGSYTVTLTVTDSRGATATNATAVTLIGLTARGYRVHGVEKVDLSLSGSSAASFDIYRNGGKIATVAGTSHTDTVGKTGPGSYIYQVCEAATSTCSNEAKITF